MERYLLKADAEQFERWRAEADRNGLSLAAWLRRAAEDAVGTVVMTAESEAQISRWREFAARAGLTLNEWQVRVLEAALTESGQIDPASSEEPGSRTVGAGRGSRPAAAPAPDSASAEKIRPLRGEGKAAAATDRQVGADGLPGGALEPVARTGVAGPAGEPKVRVRSTGEADPLGVRGGKPAAPKKSVRLREGKVKPVACKQHEGDAKAWCGRCREATSSVGGTWA